MSSEDLIERQNDWNIKAAISGITAGLLCGIPIIYFAIFAPKTSMSYTFTCFGFMIVDVCLAIKILQIKWLGEFPLTRRTRRKLLLVRRSKESKRMRLRLTLIGCAVTLPLSIGTYFVSRPGYLDFFLLTIAWLLIPIIGFNIDEAVGIV